MRPTIGYLPSQSRAAFSERNSGAHSRWSLVGLRARLQLRGSGGISPRFPNIPLRANGCELSGAVVTQAAAGCWSMFL